MKKRILSVLMSAVLLTACTGQVAAAAGLTVTKGETAIDTQDKATIINGRTYVPFHFIIDAFYPQAKISWELGKAVVRDTDLELVLQPGARYMICNGRYLYTPDSMYMEDGGLMVPLRILCTALGIGVAWDAANRLAILTPGSGPIQHGDEFYDEEDLYWLSHVIYAESGNQSLEGKIAVGNVVMNRLESPNFPNTIKGVLYQRNQFSTVSNGTIYLTPNEQSVVAAKLVLEGVNTAGDSLFFVNPKLSPNSWASRNRTYVATIGAHAFFA